MSKKLNETAMQTELSTSAFFKPSSQPEDNNSTPRPESPSLRPQKRSISAPSSRPEESPTLPENEPEKAAVSGGAIKSSAKHSPIIVTNDGINERSNERTKEVFNNRTKMRHTFDIFADQLLSLRKISIEREDRFGQRVLLGDLVQEALDMFITKERNKE